MLQSLSNDQLHHYAPSIFAESGSENTSDKYTHVSTIEVIEALRNEGFQPVKAMQCFTRKKENKDFTKHMVRLRHVNAVANEQGLFPELVLTNSHNGLSSYKLQAGVYRMVCSNGMIAGTTYDEVRVKHQGDIIGNVIEGSYSVIKESGKLIEAADTMSSMILTAPEKRIFAESVHQIYFEDKNPELAQAIEADRFLRPKRYDDRKEDLFTVFNVAQENAIRGGIRSQYYKNAQGNYGRTSLREVKSIDRNSSLNKALWSLAEKMMELKAA